METTRIGQIWQIHTYNVSSYLHTHTFVGRSTRRCLTSTTSSNTWRPVCSRRRAESCSTSSRTQPRCRCGHFFDQTRADLGGLCSYGEAGVPGAKSVPTWALARHPARSTLDPNGCPPPPPHSPPRPKCTLPPSPLTPPLPPSPTLNVPHSSPPLYPAPI